MAGGSMLMAGEGPRASSRCPALASPLPPPCWKRPRWLERLLFAWNEFIVGFLINPFYGVMMATPDGRRRDDLCMCLERSMFEVRPY